MYGLNGLQNLTRQKLYGCAWPRTIGFFFSFVAGFSFSLCFFRPPFFVEFLYNFQKKVAQDTCMRKCNGPDLSTAHGGDGRCNSTTSSHKSAATTHGDGQKPQTGQFRLLLVDRISTFHILGFLFNGSSNFNSI